MNIKKQLPNSITLLRLILIIPITANLLIGNDVLAFYLFIIAALSDGLDGFIARHFNWTSQFGAMADPAADKLLMFSTYVTLGYLGDLPLWLVIIVIGRDLILVAGWIVYRYWIEEPVYSATLLSKVNTVLQLILVILVLFNKIYNSIPELVIMIFVYAVAAFTLFTLVDYIRLWGRQAYIIKTKFKREKI